MGKGEGCIQLEYLCPKETSKAKSEETQKEAAQIVAQVVLQSLGGSGNRCNQEEYLTRGNI